MNLHIYWQSLGDFIAMGGYGRYVWGSALVTLAVLAGEQLLLGARRRAAIERIHELRDARAADHFVDGLPDFNAMQRGDHA